jgi:putative oxidoreductase
MNYIAAFVGRIFIALLFLYSGTMKLIDSTAAEGMLAGVGLPPGLAMVAGAFEVIAALCLILGFMTRLAAILLAGYVALTILFFHNDFGNQMGMTAALSHLALIGGLLCLFAHSQMRWSYDSMRLERKAEIARRDADARVHDAEVRAAHAEGRVAAAPGAVVTDVDHDGRPEVRKRRWFGF